jgi:cephalosporin-C deacetylase-like acetyl esterase
VSLPHRATADLQISVQYVVHAIRTLSRATRRRIAVAGISQGGLLARVALTYWPSLRRQVADVVTAAATHRGAMPSLRRQSLLVPAACVDHVHVHEPQ